MSASRLPHACLSGQVHEPGGYALPKNGHPGRWTLVFPNWSKYLKKSITWLSRHPARVMGASGSLGTVRRCSSLDAFVTRTDSVAQVMSSDQMGLLPMDRLPYSDRIYSVWIYRQLMLKP
ncbi:hypothetical protein SO802_000140 [Lithocarpus litseifolius]|uniref:Uncharacterized protein n=1 Tax=Lithocarpus litseifolius TaxID=425828 RepID=A0AAW2DWI9_9ROSI